MKRAVGVIVLMTVCAAPAAAHHGKDFLIVESYELPQRGTVYFVSSEELDRVDGATTFHSEPSLLFGVGDRVAGEVHVHLDRQPGEGLRYEAVAPAIHIQLTPPESERPWKFAASAEYEFAHHSRDDALATTFIAARAFGNAALVINAGAEHQRTGGTHALYAVGFRPQLDVHVGWGIEAAGRLQHGEPQQLIFGVYTQPFERLTIKAGAGASFGNGRPGAVVRSGIVWSF